MIEATNEGRKRELIPAGSYPARCYSMIHVGTNIENIMGVEKVLNKVRITWELPTETRVFNEENGEQPFVISKEYTLSMHEKSNLRADLEGWRGAGFTEDQAKSFDITKLLGIECLLSIIHKVSKSGNEYANISSISRMPKGMECPKQINDTFEFNFTDHFSYEVLETLPDFIKDKIKTSDEYQALLGSANIEESTEVFTEPSAEQDDLPF